MMLLLVLAISAAPQEKIKGEKRGPSTPQERQKFLELAQQMEHDPLGKDAADTRASLIKFLIDVPDIHVEACDNVPELLKDENDKIASAIWMQDVIAQGEFAIQYPDWAEDTYLLWTAGVGGSLNLYEAILKASSPKHYPALDDLLVKRDRGELADATLEMAKRCTQNKLQMPKLPDDKLARAQAFLHSGTVFHDHGLYQLAIIQYRRVIELTPDRYQGYYEMANTLSSLGQPGRAIQFAREAVRIGPDCWACHQELANELDDDHQGELAVQEYEKAMALAPHEPQVPMNLGLCLHQLHRDVEAIAALQKSAALDPKYSSAPLKLAHVYVDLGEHYAAEAEYNKFLELEPDTPRSQAVRDKLGIHISMEGDKVDQHSRAFEAYAGYGRTRARWIATTHRVRFPGAKGYQRTLPEEFEALQQEAKTWEEGRAGPPPASQPDLDRLVKIYQAGFLEPFVVSYFRQYAPDACDHWEQDHPGVADKFRTWADANNVSTAPIDQPMTIWWLGVKF